MDSVDFKIKIGEKTENIETAQLWNFLGKLHLKCGENDFMALQTKRNEFSSLLPLRLHCGKYIYLFR